MVFLALTMSKTGKKNRVFPIIAHHYGINTMMGAIGYRTTKLGGYNGKDPKNRHCVAIRASIHFVTRPLKTFLVTLTINFQRLFALTGALMGISREQMAQLGLTRTEFIIDCSYESFQCNDSLFREVTSAEYGKGIPYVQ